jgi:hypothetical protein
MGMKVQRILLTVLCAVSVAAASAQQSPIEIATVLSRATDYVTQYEAELGNLIGSEEYVQSSVWMDNSTPPRVAKRLQRRTSGDFLIIQVGEEWAALRKINRVDGIKVKETAPSFDSAFDNSPEANSALLKSMKLESTEYNLGDIQREINLPTFALHVLRKNEVNRFAFERVGTARIDGVQTWRIRFRETSGRSLVVSGKGENLYSNGMLWIEPETGRVLQTEFNVENPYASSKIKGQINVTYGQGKNVKIWVPTYMIEHYESAHNNVDCRADYSNFRPFLVDVKFEIEAPKQ